jgi:hypothetical protein
MTAFYANRIVAGSCNNCQDRIDHLVVEVQLDHLTFRLCKKCADELKDAIACTLDDEPYVDHNEQEGGEG